MTAIANMTPRTSAAILISFDPKEADRYEYERNDASMRKVYDKSRPRKNPTITGVILTLDNPNAMKRKFEGKGLSENKNVSKKIRGSVSPTNFLKYRRFSAPFLGIYFPKNWEYLYMTYLPMTEPMTPNNASSMISS